RLDFSAEHVRVTINHESQSPRQLVLEEMARQLGLVLREEGGIFYVHTAAWQREQQTRKEQERAQRLLDAPLHSHSIPF
ncbi:hypothetical protein NL353_27560, partial [Klebsiella pneumoniae]|nr:hypothetical protein [Klebsiella pneumoniae]